MDNKQLLQEIAYYSGIINQHKQNACQKLFSFQNNKYRYIKQTEPAVIIPVEKSISKKVLINPNFKHKVHVNPHFNYNSRKILVNPKILAPNVPLNPVNNINTTPSTSSISNVSVQNLDRFNVRSNVRKRRTSIRSKYKIVKSSSNSVNGTSGVVKSSIYSASQSETTIRKRRSSIRSKYKIVKSSVLISKSAKTKTPTIKNRYKIDHRTVNICNKSLVKKKVLKYGISDLLRNKLFKNRTWMQNCVINQFKSSPNTRLTNISGILYKKSQTKLQKVQPKSSDVKERKRLVSITGKKYVLNNNKKALRLISTSEKYNIRRVSTKTVSGKKTAGIKNATKDTSRKLKSKNLKQQINKLRKNNQPCPVYQRFGKCRRKELGRCIFLHNPNQIFLCKKFLQGACVDDNCLLSHKVSLEKMPTCKYFLEGCCVKNNCPYLHVKISPKADICKKFLEGFCEKGSQCNLRHQFLCPNFERDGKCLRRKCLYPHKVKCEKEPKEKRKSPVVSEKPVVEEIVPVETTRYYEDLKKEDVEEQVDVSPPQVSGEINDDEVFKRPQLGALPSFIPLD